jgi:hypothetical protein
MKIFTASETTSSEQIYNQQVSLLQSSNCASIEFAIRFSYVTYYCADTNCSNLPLCAVFSCHKRLDEQGSFINSFCAVFETSAQSIADINHLNFTNPTDSPIPDFSNQSEITIDYHTQPTKALIRWLNEHSCPLLDIDQALFLQPVSIEKPWGKEIWFTGIEARGQAQFIDLQQPNLSTPLPWLLDLLPAHFNLPFNQSPILLKTLDPIADEVFGDLYFEMHQQKQEVYVVTALDKNAWPDGVGKMRFGFNKQKMVEYANLNDFKLDFLQAVTRYRQTRSQIDSLLDKQKLAINIPLDQAVNLDLMKAWLADIPQSLISIESKQRVDIEGFIGHKSVRVGDVIKIPFNTPHSLMHGIRTIEFQTPVYERQIICFWQKVLTQDHWDTEQALELIDFNYQRTTKLDLIEECENYSIDKIVDYPTFEVFRYDLRSLVSICLPDIKSYALLTSVTHDIQVDKLFLSAEQSCYISGKYSTEGRRNKITNLSKSRSVILLALPKV